MTTLASAPPFLPDPTGVPVLLVDYDGAAKFLGLDSPNWLQEHIAELPCVRLGKFVRFSLANLLEILEIRQCRPSAAPASVPAALVELKPGRAPRARRKSA
jgi:hypothetical protein